MRIKYIVPFPFDEVGLANRAAQLPDELRTPGVDYEFVPVRNSCHNADSAYELLLLDMYIAEAGFASEDEGYDAVVMDTVSDSGLAALRSRLSIPVLGPGLVQQHVAAMLGKRFSILTMWERWRPLYEKTMAEYGTGHYCASIRSIGKRPDQEQLLAGREEIVFDALEREGRAAIEEDHADVILIGSTTMHQSVEHLRRTLGVPVINPGPLTIKLAELFVTLGLTTPRRPTWRPRSPGREVQLADGGLDRLERTPAGGGGASRSPPARACAARSDQRVAPRGGRQLHARRQPGAVEPGGDRRRGQVREAPRVGEAGELGGDGDHVGVGAQRRGRVRRRREQQVHVVEDLQHAHPPVAHPRRGRGRRRDRVTALPSSRRRRTSAPKRSGSSRQALAVQAGGLGADEERRDAGGRVSAPSRSTSTTSRPSSASTSAAACVFAAIGGSTSSKKKRRGRPTRRPATPACSPARGSSKACSTAYGSSRS